MSPLSDSPKLPAHVERRLARDMGRALNDFHLIDDGDRLLVAMSGGKDSYAMCVLLRDLQRRAPIRFEIVAVHVDQGHPGYDGAPLESWLRVQGVPYHVIHEDTYSIVTDKIPEGKTYCSLCSRLRRGILYQAATDLDCNKIALGHHRDDADVGELAVVARDQHDVFVIAHRNGERDAHAREDDGVIEGDQAQRVHGYQLPIYLRLGSKCSMVQTRISTRA
jgi:predicted PP-loop superfamily ATPase